MERDGHAVAASFFIDEEFVIGTTVALPEAAAHHARVKRLEPGGVVRLTNGAGLVADAVIAALDKRIADVDVRGVERVDAPAPVHLRVPIGDRDRMLWLAEKAMELGIASWQAVRFRRSASVSPRGEGEAFATKVRARMISALEQSGGAWLPHLLPDVSFDALVAKPIGGAIVLDRTGDPLPDVLASNVGSPTLLFGPEGGIEPDEADALRGALWRPARLANTVLRFETAGIAALAVCRAHLIAGARDG